eukprot:CAMPEP_0203745308 /NCGR_PEP_ID=MMETSP0098-20131031/1088_1 /ASSEMBLY_ACC=CAM_ASM_000208 /TAXON_ID=96639 /ORGANISM=" , Strain NY0313808BC1" /LENGTH=420 /DNA_ID=CAMNT_0050633049 /DNA_START=194 /DNA_END=1456 /DNA_ORIENTATION=+
MKSFLGLAALAVISNVGICHGDQHIRSPAKELDKNILPMRSLQSVDPISTAKDAIDALKSITELVDWVGDKLIDKELIKKASEYIANRNAKFEEIAGAEGKEAMVQLAGTGSKYRAVNLTVTRMVTTLQGNVDNTKYLMNMVPSGTVEGDNKDTLAASLDLLAATLTQCGVDSSEQVKKLGDINLNMAKVRATMQALETRFNNAKETQSQYIKNKIDELRKKAYLGCIASIIGGPVAIAACYSAASIVIETQTIPALQADLAASNKMMAGFTTNFQVLENLAGSLENDTATKASALSEFQSEVDVATTFVKATKKVNVAVALRAKYLKLLDELTQACTKVLNSFANKVGTVYDASEKARHLLLGAHNGGADDPVQKLLLETSISSANKQVLSLFQRVTKNLSNVSVGQRYSNTQNTTRTV